VGRAGVNLAAETGAVLEGAIAIVPAADYSVSDTWFTAGMRGTGSDTLTVEDVFVPQHRVVSRARLAAGDHPTEHKDEVAFRSGWSATLTLGLIGPVLGLGRAALDHVRDAAGTKRMAATVFDRQADSAAFQPSSPTPRCGSTARICTPTGRPTTSTSTPRVASRPVCPRGLGRVRTRAELPRTC
jgi:hypothetical protein